jgi:small neutral amino acid transporter SnatA (MarC family)
VTATARAVNAGLLLAFLLVVAFAVGAPPERCPTVTAPELKHSAQATVDWFVRNQKPDGTWLYEYDKGTDKASAEYNFVRHAGAVMGLYQAAGLGLPGAVNSADAGAKWMIARLRKKGDWSAFESNGVSETGSSALLLAGLAVRRDATGEASADDIMKRLGRFLVAMTEPSGAVSAYYDWGRGPRRGEYSKYYTGEAYWALARLHLLFPKEGWGKAADRIGAYLATKRDSAEHHFPPIADHWAGYGLADTVQFPERGNPPLTQDELDYARKQAELFGAQARWVEVRAGRWGLLARGPMVSRGGGYGVIDEGFTGLWRAAGEDPRLGDIRGAMAKQAVCVAGLAVDSQSGSAEAQASKNPSRVEGAWFRDGVTRMDDQQHALAGILRTIPMVAAARAADGEREDPAPALLWILALLLALNPARAAFGIARTGDAARVAATGGALGGLAICGVALLADPLLGALNVSAPGFRTVAGVLALLLGAHDLFRRPPSPDPALPGSRAALVPVAFPLVARPALLVMALGVGADCSVLVPLAALAVGVAALTFLVARVPPGARLRWGARLLAVGLVVCGVLLAIDGVLSV